MTAFPAAPAKLTEADLSGLPRVQHPPELHSSEAARRATPEERDIATRLFEMTCRGDYKPGSFPNDLDEIAFAARTTRRRLAHRWAMIIELLGLYMCDDGRLWSELAIPVCEDAWGRRVSVRAAVRTRLRPSAAPRSMGVPMPPHRRRKDRSESIRTPFGLHSVTETEDSRGSVPQEGKAEGEESHTHLTDSVAEAASLRSAGVCDSSLEREREKPAVADQPASVRRQSSAFRQDFDALVWPNSSAREAAWPFYRKARIDNPDLSAADIGAAVDRFVETLEKKYDGSTTMVSRYAGQLRNWLRDKRWLEEYEDTGAYGYDKRTYRSPYDPEEIADEWRRHMTWWLAGGRNWLDEAWGPAPGEWRCRVPAKILAEFGLPPGRDD